jgi:hypothetical protein
MGLHFDTVLDLVAAATVVVRLVALAIQTIVAPLLFLKKAGWPAARAILMYSNMSTGKSTRE